MSGWPGLHVRPTAPSRPDDEKVAEYDPDRLKVLRLERLAPAVLLVLFDGVPAVVHVEEPRQGIQFGALAGPDDDRGDAPAARRVDGQRLDSCPTGAGSRCRSAGAPG